MKEIGLYVTSFEPRLKKLTAGHRANGFEYVLM
jgi:hypothetical protein